MASHMYNVRGEDDAEVPGSLTTVPPFGVFRRSRPETPSVPPLTLFESTMAVDETKAALIEGDATTLIHIPILPGRFSYLLTTYFPPSGTLPLHSETESS